MQAFEESDTILGRRCRVHGLISLPIFLRESFSQIAGKYLAANTRFTLMPTTKFRRATGNIRLLMMSKHSEMR